MPPRKSDTTSGPVDRTDEVAFGDLGPDETQSTDDGTKRRTTRYGPEKSRNTQKPATRENSGDR